MVKAEYMIVVMLCLLCPCLTQLSIDAGHFCCVQVQCRLQQVLAVYCATQARRKENVLHFNQDGMRLVLSCLYIVQTLMIAATFECKQPLNKIPAELDKHVQGKKFRRLKLAAETKKQRKEAHGSKSTRSAAEGHKVEQDEAEEVGFWVSG